MTDWIRTLPVWSQSLVAISVVLAAGAAFMGGLYVAFVVVTS